MEKISKYLISNDYLRTEKKLNFITKNKDGITFFIIVSVIVTGYFLFLY